MALFKSKSSCIGFDIGTTSVKAVELKRIKGAPTLINYGYSEEFVDFSKQSFNLDVQKTVRIINELRKRSGIAGGDAVAAMPSFSVFSAVLNLRESSKAEMESAVMREAKKVIPLSLAEMILDWKVIDAGEQPLAAVGNSAPPVGKRNVKVLLTGAPRSLVKKYIAIFKETKLRLVSLETEMFSLIRSLVGTDPSVVAIIDLGAVNTDIAIIENGLPMFIRTLDIGGMMVTKAVSESLKVSFQRAEQFKFDLSMGGSSERTDAEMPKVIADTVSSITNEVRYSLNVYQQENNKRVDKIVLSGGGADLVNLGPYFSKALDMNVVVGDPWARVAYPLDLKAVLLETGPRMAIAVGLALRETL